MLQNSISVSRRCESWALSRIKFWGVSPEQACAPAFVPSSNYFLFVNHPGGACAPPGKTSFLKVALSYRLAGSQHHYYSEQF